MYLLYPVMNRMEVMICQTFYCPVIIQASRKKVKNVTLLNVQNGHIRYSKLTAKEAEGLQ